MDFSTSYRVYGNLIAHLGIDVSGLQKKTFDEASFMKMLEKLCNYFRMKYVRLDIYVPSSTRLSLSPDLSLSTFPECRKEYCSPESGAQKDPLFNYIQRELQKRPVAYATWSEVLKNEKRFRDSGQASPETGADDYWRFMYKEAEAGLGSGVIIAKRNMSHKIVLNFASAKNSYDTERDFTGEKWRLLYTALLLVEDMLNYLVLENQNTPPETENREAPGITRKETEILSSFLENPAANIAEVARSRYVSVNTVNFHLKRLRKRFDVPRISGYQLALVLKKRCLL
ncbi:MAG: winged helix-turn-helix transcriptional regulator [Pseudomonadales bacterium]|nr:winged helix-turn-helix transcriptional regulator [Pseudomonadales bacterium]